MKTLLLAFALLAPIAQAAPVHRACCTAAPRIVRMPVHVASPSLPPRPVRR
jgi:hypothetical protein